MGSLRFLVVEDHGFQRWLICDMLRHLGAASVEAVGDGGAALEALARGDAIDIVVSDLDMPGVDGMALFRLMAERGHRAALLVVSAQEASLLATVESMAKAYGVNYLGTIQKPLSAGKFLSAIGQHRHQPPQAANAQSRGITREEIAAGLRRGEFEPFFQPKTDVRSGRLQGAEALARWRHPELGLLSPATFLETAERDGLIDELTDRIARRAFAACRQWLAQGRDMGVSVNLCALSLEDPSLAERMTQLSAEAGVEQRHVTFEVTESAAARDLGPALENLSRLRMRGFELSIDDFGTGYSSMHRLAQFPFTELKIDQSFVKNATRDNQSRVLVQSGVELADRLGIRAVAEGVETRSEWEMVLSHGCPYAQGYFIAEPMAPDEFLAWLANRTADCA